MKRLQFLKSLLVLPALTINPAMLYQDDDLNRIRKVIDSMNFKIVSKQYEARTCNSIFFEIQNRENEFVAWLDKITPQWLESVKRYYSDEQYEYLKNNCLGKIACSSVGEIDPHSSQLFWLLNGITPYISDFFIDE